MGGEIRLWSDLWGRRKKRWGVNLVMRFGEEWLVKIMQFLNCTCGFNGIWNNRKNREGLFRSLSDSLPTHCRLDLESFSLLTEYHGVDGYKSKKFEAGGYLRKLVLYPNGNRKKNVEDYISVYLRIVRKDTLQIGEYLLISDCFCLIRTREDAYTKQKCIHAGMLDVGFDKLISLKEFTDVSNGYLIDDKMIELNPEGHPRSGKHNHLSLFLGLADKQKTPVITGVYAEYILRLNPNKNNAGHRGSGLFYHNQWQTWLAQIHSIERFVRDDTLTVEAEITVVGIAEEFPKAKDIVHTTGEGFSSFNSTALVISLSTVVIVTVTSIFFKRRD
ncbi:hypothetical protein ACLB2K_037124 [Fragaria x ananassa]